VGLHHSLDDAVTAVTAGAREVTPSPATAAAYEDVYARWCALCDEMARAAIEGG
jgi:DICT domain-containing protein